MFLMSKLFRYKLKSREGAILFIDTKDLYQFIVHNLKSLNKIRFRFKLITVSFRVRKTVKYRIILALCIRICEAFCGNDRLPIEKGLNPLNSIRQHSPPPTHTFFQQNYQHYLHQCQPSHYRWEPRVLSSFQQQLLLCQPCYPWGVVVEVVEERGVWCLCLYHCPRIFQIH